MLSSTSSAGALDDPADDAGEEDGEAASRT
jgi:hypothetical protein